MQRSIEDYSDPIEVKPITSPDIGLQLDTLKLSLLTPVSFDAYTSLPYEYVHRLQGNGKLQSIGTGTNIHWQIDFSGSSYYKDRVTVRQ